METIIVCIIVGVAAVFLGRSFYKMLLIPEGAGCGCGCGGCSRGPADCGETQQGEIMVRAPEKQG